MKRFLWLYIFFCPLILLAQNIEDKFLSEKWQQVEYLREIKNYEQMSPHLSQIKSYAKQHNHSIEWVRAILAENQVKTINQPKEKGFITIRNHFQESIAQGNNLEKAILNNYYAMFLWSNASQYNTKTIDSFLLSSGTRKFEIIDSIFKESLVSKENLLNQKPESWTSLLNDIQNISLTPTIYHFLAYQYLDFLNQVKKNKEHDELRETIIAINSKNNFADATSYL